MNTERPVTFAAGDATLIGVLHLPQEVPKLGLILVVGGPQYRVGSHRLYLRLARHLAAKGLAVLRFDCRGMGDSGGDFSGFEMIAPDIVAAMDAFATFAPSLRRYVLWGLCDATLSICEVAAREPRVAGVVLVNPWVRTDATLAATHLRHYYFQRLAEKDFVWRILSGKVNAFSSAKSFFGDLYRSVVPQFSGRLGKEQARQPPNPLAHRMATGLRSFRGLVLLVLSGRDLTAQEFNDVAAKDDLWQSLLVDKQVRCEKLSEADHSFSQQSSATQLLTLTAEWLRSVEPSMVGGYCGHS